MRAIFLLFAVIVLSCSCSKEKQIDEPWVCILPMSDTIVYEGKFERITIAGSQTSDVNLKFRNGVFTGASSVNNFPAIGQGTIESYSTNKVVFKNTSYWTANFDWTLILNGEYEIRTTNDSLLLQRVRGIDEMQFYRLKRIK
jgi:hypothetical protein